MKLDESWTEGGVSGFRKSDVPNPRNHKAPHCGALRYGAAPGVEYKSNLLFLFDIYNVSEISTSKFILRSRTSLSLEECDARCAFASCLQGRPSFSYCLASGQLLGSCNP